MTILTFDSLINEALFNSIKTEFLMGDLKFQDQGLQGDSSEVDLSENDITIFEKVISTRKVKSKGYDFDLNQEIETEDDVYDSEGEEVILNFTTDFLIPKIEELTDAYKKSFVKEIKRRNSYSNSHIENFSKIWLKQLNLKMTKILAATHLENPVKDVAVNSIDEIYDFVSGEYYQIHISIPDRIPFTLNRNQVVGLFYLLYENECISHEVKQNDLFRLIEGLCSYYDSKNNTYKAIKGANKLRRSMFGQNPDKSAKTTIDELEKIFNKDFFSL